MKLALRKQIGFSISVEFITRLQSLAPASDKCASPGTIISPLREKAFIEQPVPGFHQSAVYPVVNLSIRRLVFKIVEKIVVVEDCTTIAAAVEVHKQDASEFLDFEGEQGFRIGND